MSGVRRLLELVEAVRGRLEIAEVELDPTEVVQLVRRRALVAELARELEAPRVQVSSRCLITTESRTCRLEMERPRLGSAVACGLRLRASLARQLDDAVAIAVSEGDPRDRRQPLALAAKIPRLARDAQALLGARPRALLVAGAEGEEMVGVEHTRAIDGGLAGARRVQRRSRGGRTALDVSCGEPRFAPDPRDQCERAWTITRVCECANLGSGPGRRVHREDANRAEVASADLDPAVCKSTDRVPSLPSLHSTVMKRVVFSRCEILSG